jgi:hypothetical protein
VNTSTGSIGLEATVKAIPFKFSESNNDNQSRLQEFCRVGMANNYFQSSRYDYNNNVVVAALSNFNECLRLENQGLRITHEEQPPRSVIIFGDKTKGIDFNLDVIEYDPLLISCFSPSFSDDGTSVKVGPGDPARIVKRNFSISCTRNAVVEGGKSYYPPAKIGLSTALGPYTVTLQEDTLNGFFLASQAKAAFDQAVADRLNAEREKLETAIPLDIFVTKTATVGPGYVGNVSVECPKAWKAQSYEQLSLSPPFAPWSNSGYPKVIKTENGFNVTAYNWSGDGPAALPQLLVIVAKCSRPPIAEIK